MALRIVTAAPQPTLREVGHPASILESSCSIPPDPVQTLSAGREHLKRAAAVYRSGAKGGVATASAGSVLRLKRCGRRPRRDPATR
jgi:hypothetical protein